MNSRSTVLNQPSDASVPDLEHLVARFIASTLPREEWTHLAHLAVGLWHVDRYGAGEALTRLRSGIRNLNDSHGTINSASSGYHETITRAYAQLLAEFNEHCSVHLPLAERVSNLFTSELAEKEVLLTFYSRTTLMSEKARAEWVEPDIAPIGLGWLDAVAVDNVATSRPAES
jgi:hypothetical protein